MNCPMCGAKMRKYAFVDEEAPNHNYLKERGWVCTNLMCQHKMCFKSDVKRWMKNEG